LTHLAKLLYSARARIVWRNPALRSTLVILAICGVSLSGCGTAVGALLDPDGQHFYNGVRTDAAVAVSGDPIGLAAVADLPFSAVADTLLVPSVAVNKLTAPRPQYVSGSVPPPPATFYRTQAIIEQSPAVPTPPLWEQQSGGE
jgi:uncharacterized protein YceK